MLLHPGCDASLLHGHAHLSLNQIDLSFSYRILHGKPLCIVFINLVLCKISHTTASLSFIFLQFDWLL